MEYQVKNGLVYSEYGLPASQLWFADNRLAFQFDETGVTRVEYRNPEQRAGNSIVFLKGLYDGLRYYLEQNEVTYKAEYCNNTIWPFGIDSEWSFESANFKHSMYAIKDSIVIKLVTPEKIPSDLRFKLEFIETFTFIPAEQSNYVLGNMGATRTWDKWEYDIKDQLIINRYSEKMIFQANRAEDDVRSYFVEFEGSDKDAVLQVQIGADFKVEHAKRNAKHVLRSPELEAGKEYHFVISFTGGDHKDVDTYKKELSCIKTSIENQMLRYRRIIGNIPKLLSPYQQLNDFISLAPLYHESLKATEHPGAIRAKTSNYWVWGWDGLTNNCAYFYWGEKDFIKEMLKFYEQTADPKWGLAHAYRNDMSIASISEIPSQGMYITLLHQYYNNTNDLDEVKKRYGFAKKIYKSMAALEVSGTGYCKATSLMPDLPGYMKETGNDISSFNNTVFYCASRSMEFLSAILEDEETKSLSESFFKKIESNFIDLFFDEQKGYVVGSIDADTFERRNCYSAYAVKWDNEYLSDLVESIYQECLNFFVENLVCKAGVRPIPVWDSAFDGDANQLRSWFPVMSEFYMKLINTGNRKDLIEQWVGWVSYWMKKLTIPEGVSCYIDTCEPELDRWDALCGTWQAFSARGWYQAIVHGIVGVGIDAGGVTFYPYEGEKMQIQGLHYAGRKIDIEMCGSGQYIEVIEVDGNEIKGTNKLPESFLKDKDEVAIKVKRVKENPYKTFIKNAIGVRFDDYSYEEGRICAKLKGAGTSYIKIATQKEILVKLDGKDILVRYNEKLGVAFVEVKISADETKVLEVLF